MISTSMCVGLTSRGASCGWAVYVPASQPAPPRPTVASHLDRLLASHPFLRQLGPAGHGRLVHGAGVKPKVVGDLRGAGCGLWVAAGAWWSVAAAPRGPIEAQFRWAIRMLQVAAAAAACRGGAAARVAKCTAKPSWTKQPNKPESQQACHHVVSTQHTSTSMHVARNGAHRRQAVVMPLAAPACAHPGSRARG